MSNTFQRKETKILPSSMIDSHLSYFGRPVMQAEIVEEDLSPSVDISELNLPSELMSRMFAHQVEGVKWLYGLHTYHPGGILGDDMGLGKTFQVNCLLTGLMRSNKIQKVLIIAPVSVLPSWNRELVQHLAPYVKRIGIEMCSAEMTKKRRQKIVSDVFASRNCRIVISSYHLVANMTDDFADGGSWDYVILDEGHIIKNPTTKLSKAMHMLKSDHRLILTGTPVQNNLIEFWALVDWATSGNLLGTKANFKSRYVDPILAGQDPKAPASRIEESKIAAKHLMKCVRPILLQRKKCEHKEALKLTEKVELVVWIPLASTQRKVYEKYLRKRTVQDAMDRTSFAVDVINDLKTICRHPFLMEASEVVRQINAVKKRDALTGSHSHERGRGQRQEKGAPSSFNFDSMGSALESISKTPTGCSRSYKRGVKEDEYGERDEEEEFEEEEGYNVGRSKDSRFNTSHADKNSDPSKPYKSSSFSSSQMSRTDTSTQRSNKNVNSEHHTYDDCDNDDDRESPAGHKLSAQANVFETAGRVPDVEELLQDSVKLRVLVKLTQRLKRRGHRLLIFSQSKKMVDIIQKVLSSYGMSSCRVDGSVTGRDRQKIIDSFNEGGINPGDDDDYDYPKGTRSSDSEGVKMGPDICLLTTKACGQGITLTGADRVVIFDPSWNPAEDRQAVDRAFRIGQKKDVVVYRLIMASSVEEKMYEKQVFKDGIRIVTESGSSSRYFSNAETKDLFTLGPQDKSEVMERLWELVGTKLKSYEDTGGDLPKVFGYTRHDTLYEEARPKEIQDRSDKKGVHNNAKVGPKGLQTIFAPLRDLDENIGEDIGLAVKRKEVIRGVQSHPTPRPTPPMSRNIDLSLDSPPPRKAGGRVSTSKILTPDDVDRTAVVDLIDESSAEEEKRIEEEDNRGEEGDHEEEEEEEAEWDDFIPLTNVHSSSTSRRETIALKSDIHGNDQRCDAAPEGNFHHKTGTVDDDENEGEEGEGRGVKESVDDDGIDEEEEVYENHELDLDGNGENGAEFNAYTEVEVEEDREAESPIYTSDGECEISFKSKASAGEEVSLDECMCDSAEKGSDGRRRGPFSVGGGGDCEDTEREMGRGSGRGRGGGSNSEGGEVEAHEECEGEGAFKDTHHVSTHAGDRTSHLSDHLDRISGECDFTGHAAQSGQHSLVIKSLQESDSGSVHLREENTSGAEEWYGLPSEDVKVKNNSDTKGEEEEEDDVGSSDSRTMKAERIRSHPHRAIISTTTPSVTPSEAVTEQSESEKRLSVLDDTRGETDEDMDNDGDHLPVDDDSVSEDDCTVHTLVDCNIMEDQCEDDSDVCDTEAILVEEEVEESPHSADVSRQEEEGEEDNVQNNSGEWEAQDFEYVGFDTNYPQEEALEEGDEESDSCSEDSHNYSAASDSPSVQSQRVTENSVLSPYISNERVETGSDEELAMEKGDEIVHASPVASIVTALDVSMERDERQPSSSHTVEDDDEDDKTMCGSQRSTAGSDTVVDVHASSESGRARVVQNKEKGGLLSPTAVDDVILSSAEQNSINATPHKAIDMSTLASEIDQMANGVTASSPAPGAAYCTPGRVVLHVPTAHSSRGFCIDLDSESDSDHEKSQEEEKEEEGLNENEEECSVEEDNQDDACSTISPLRVSPVAPPQSFSRPGLRSLVQVTPSPTALSPAFSAPMSPMSQSTVSSNLTSHSLSPHAIRSLALSRINLSTQSCLKACPPTMAAETGRAPRMQARDLFRMRLDGNAFESSPTKPDKESGDKLAPRLVRVNKVDFVDQVNIVRSTGDVDRNRDSDADGGENGSEVEEEEMSEAGTLDVDLEDEMMRLVNDSAVEEEDDIDIDIDTSRSRMLRALNNEEEEEEEEEEEDWVPKSTRKILKKPSHDFGSECGLGSAVKEQKTGRLQKNILFQGQKDRDYRGITHLDLCDDADEMDGDVEMLVEASVGSEYTRKSGIKSKVQDVRLYEEEEEEEGSEDSFIAYSDSDSDSDTPLSRGVLTESELLRLQTGRNGLKGLDLKAAAPRGKQLYLEEAEEVEEEADNGDGEADDGEVLGSEDSDDDGDESEAEKSVGGDDDDYSGQDEGEDGHSDSGNNVAEFQLTFEEERISKCANVSFAQFKSVDIVALLEIAGDPHSAQSSDKENVRNASNSRVVTQIDASVMSDKKKVLYNTKILAAQKKEGKGQYEECLELYLEALEVCDSDASLHGKMAYLSQQLGFF